MFKFIKWGIENDNEVIGTFAAFSCFIIFIMWAVSMVIATLTGTWVMVLILFTPIIYVIIEILALYKKEMDETND